MSERDASSASGVGLSEAIGLLRDELLRARAAGAGSDIQLPVESMTPALRSCDEPVPPNSWTTPIDIINSSGSMHRNLSFRVSVRLFQPFKLGCPAPCWVR